MCHPSMLIYLDVSPEEGLTRINKRGRECENSISLEYLQGLHEEYQKFMQEINVKSLFSPIFKSVCNYRFRE